MLLLFCLPRKKNGRQSINGRDGEQLKRRCCQSNKVCQMPHCCFVFSFFFFLFLFDFDFDSFFFFFYLFLLGFSGVCVCTSSLLGIPSIYLIKSRHWLTHIRKTTTRETKRKGKKRGGGERKFQKKKFEKVSFSCFVFLPFSLPLPIFFSDSREWIGSNSTPESPLVDKGPTEITI